MYFIYLLLLDEIPIYAGITNNPMGRYRQHYSTNDCGTYSVVRYFMFNKNKMVAMKLVYCTNDRDYAFYMEKKAIHFLIEADFDIINKTTKEHSFPKLTDKLKKPRNLFTSKALQYIKDNQNEILKEYGYK